MSGQLNRNGDRIGRIREMERCFDEAHAAVTSLEKAIGAFHAALPALQRLRDYQESGQWLRDYEADERGELPEDLKRGVLSEDGLYNLLECAQTLSDHLKYK